MSDMTPEELDAQARHWHRVALQTRQRAEQAEDALAAWNRIKDRDPHDPLTQLEIMREKAEREGVGIAHQYNVIRHALTASADRPCPHVRTSAEGTSYCTLAESASAPQHASAVPEEVRRLPNAFRAEGGEAIAFYGAGPSDVAEACADELERALASAPAVCEWEYKRTSLGRDGYRGSCGADWWCEEGYGPAVIRDVHPYCHGCGRRIYLAAAPTKGGRTSE